MKQIRKKEASIESNRSPIVARSNPMDQFRGHGTCVAKNAYVRASAISSDDEAEGGGIRCGWIDHLRALVCAPCWPCLGSNCPSDDPQPPTSVHHRSDIHRLISTPLFIIQSHPPKNRRPHQQVLLCRPPRHSHRAGAPATEQRTWSHHDQQQRPCWRVPGGDHNDEDADAP